MTEWQKKTGKEIREIVLNIRNDITNLLTGEAIIMDLVKRELNDLITTLNSASPDRIYEILKERSLIE